MWRPWNSIAGNAPQNHNSANATGPQRRLDCDDREHRSDERQAAAVDRLRQPAACLPHALQHRVRDAHRHDAVGQPERQVDDADDGSDAARHHVGGKAGGEPEDVILARAIVGTRQHRQRRIGRMQPAPVGAHDSLDVAVVVRVRKVVRGPRKADVQVLVVRRREAEEHDVPQAAVARIGLQDRQRDHREHRERRGRTREPGSQRPEPIERRRSEQHDQKRHEVQRDVGAHAEAESLHGAEERADRDEAARPPLRRRDAHRHEHEHEEGRLRVVPEVRHVLEVAVRERPEKDDDQRDDPAAAESNRGVRRGDGGGEQRGDERVERAEVDAGDAPHERSRRHEVPAGAVESAQRHDANRRGHLVASQRRRALLQEVVERRHASRIDVREPAPARHHHGGPELILVELRHAAAAAIHGQVPRREQKRHHAERGRDREVGARPARRFARRRVGRRWGRVRLLNPEWKRVHASTRSVRLRPPASSEGHR